MKVVFYILLLFILSPSTKIGTLEGNQAPEINLPNTNGDTIKLSSLKGHIILLHFWSSFCSPCYKENPKVIKLYEKYKDKKYKTGNGLIVIYVSLDQNKSDWITAIQSNNLSTFINLSDLKGKKSQISDTYKIKYIPDNFLIDGNGIIILNGVNFDYFQTYLNDGSL